MPVNADLESGLPTRDEMRKRTADTCFRVLKTPVVSDKDVLGFITKVMSGQ